MHKKAHTYLLRLHTHKHLVKCSDKVKAIWQTVLQKCRRIPHVHIAGDFLIICTLLLFTPPNSIGFFINQLLSMLEVQTSAAAFLSRLMCLFEASQPVVDIGPHLTDYLSA